MSEQRSYSPSSQVNVPDSMGRALIFLCAFLTGICVMGTAWALFESMRAQERADVLQYEVESFKNVLHAKGYPTFEHLPGESP